MVCIQSLLLSLYSYCSSNFVIAKVAALNLFGREDLYKKWSKEVKSDNFCYCKVGRAITIWGAIENGAFPQTFVWRNYISTAQGKNDRLRYKVIISSHKVCGNAIPIISMIKISIYYRRNLNLFHANTLIL